MICLALGVLTGATGCGGRAAQLADSGHVDAFGASLSATVAGDPYSFGGLVVCTTGPGPVTVVAVTPSKPTGGLTVQAVAVRPNPIGHGGFLYGDGHVTLQDAGTARDPMGVLPGARFDPNGSTVVEGRCSSSDSAAIDASELAIQVTKSSPGTAATQGIDVHYVVGSHPNGSHRGVLHVPMTIVLCGPNDHRTRGCVS
jgi:hypothetical protein